MATRWEQNGSVTRCERQERDHAWGWGRQPPWTHTTTPRAMVLSLLPSFKSQTAILSASHHFSSLVLALPCPSNISCENSMDGFDGARDWSCQHDLLVQHGPQECVRLRGYLGILGQSDHVAASFSHHHQEIYMEVVDGSSLQIQMEGMLSDLVFVLSCLFLRFSIFVFFSLFFKRFGHTNSPNSFQLLMNVYYEVGSWCRVYFTSVRLILLRTPSK